MIVKSPLKEKKTRPNVRKEPAGPKKKPRANSRGHSLSDTDNYGRRIKKEGKQKRISLPRLQPWKVILGAIIMGILGILYLNHVFATQKLLREVQQLEQKYNQAKRLHDDYRLTYDRMIGPSEIYEKAKNHGFINGGPAEKVIEVEQE